MMNATMLNNKRPRLGGKKVAGLLLKHLDGAMECGDLATMDAANEVVDSRVRDGYAALCELWSRDDGEDFVDWLMVTSPSLGGQLKRATGFDQEQWLWLV
jgi:hypothetical protein